jgi:hypothetical protein
MESLRLNRYLLSIFCVLFVVTVPAAAQEAIESNQEDSPQPTAETTESSDSPESSLSDAAAGEAATTGDGAATQPAAAGDTSNRATETDASGATAGAGAGAAGAATAGDGTGAAGAANAGDGTAAASAADGEQPGSLGERNIATLSVSGVPQDATVHLDGIERGSTPLRLELPSGTYQIRLEADKFRTIEDEIVVDGDSEYHYELKRKVASLEIDSVPSGATLLIDGIPFGTTPTTARVYHGNHVVTYKRPEFEEHTRRIRVTGDGSLQLKFTQFATPAYVSIAADPVFPDGEEVLIDGTSVGFTPLQDVEVYGSETVVTIGEVKRTLSFVPGQRYRIAPKNPVPEDPGGASINLPGYSSVEPPPNLLPEYRVSRHGEQSLSIDGRTMTAGGVLSVLAGCVVGSSMALRGAETGPSVAVGAGFAVAAGAAVAVTAVERSRIEPYTRIPLEKNIAKNTRMLEQWRTRNDALLAANARLLASVNAQRGEWEVVELGEVEAAE